MRPRQLFVVTRLGVGLSCLAVAACGNGSAPPTAGGASTPDTEVRVAAVGGFRLVKAPMIVRDDVAGQASDVTVYFRVNRRLPEGSYATVDGQRPASRVLTRFVPRNERCYRLDAGGTKKSPWMGVPLGTSATFRLHIHGQPRALTAEAPLQAPLPIEKNSKGLGSPDLPYEHRLHCTRTRHAS
jgi:hypothetical protein